MERRRFSGVMLLFIVLAVVLITQVVGNLGRSGDVSYSDMRAYFTAEKVKSFTATDTRLVAKLQDGSSVSCALHSFDTFYNDMNDLVVSQAEKGVITSYDYAAGNARRVRQTFRLLLKVCLGYALVLWACIQLFPGAFARIFTPEPELVAFTAGMLRIYCGALFLMGIQIACQMTFVSIGNAPCSIVVAVLRKFVLLLPLIYLLPHLLADQTRAVFLAEPVADTIAVTGTVLLFSFQFRKALRKLESENKT